MKKLILQLTIGFIFLVFGFMITTQISIINRKLSSTGSEHNTEAIASDNEQLKKQIDELQKKADELTNRNEEFKQAGFGINDEAEIILKNLKDTKLIAGLSEVKGEGITINIVPKTNLVLKPPNHKPIIDLDLLIITNSLKAAGAEAVSINDIRLIGTGGIRTAGDYNIIINDQRISPHQSVTIKAIGNKNNLEGVLSFPGAITESLSKNCDIALETNDNIVVKRAKNTFIYRFVENASKID